MPFCHLYITVSLLLDKKIELAAAIGAGALEHRATVLRGNLNWIFDFLLGLTFNTICLCHQKHLRKNHSSHIYIHGMTEHCHTLS